MSNPKRRVRRNALATSVSVALLGAIVAPATATDPRSALKSSTTTHSPNVRLPDLGSDIPRNRDPEVEALEALKWVAQAGSADAVLNGAVDRGLSAGLDAARDTHLPFLGNLQGAVRWNDATNAFDFDLLSIYALKGTGEGHNWLVQLGGHNIANRFTINSGLVYRWVDLESQWLLGGNVFLDHDIDGGVSRVGVGAEAATPSTCSATARPSAIRPSGRSRPRCNRCRRSASRPNTGWSRAATPIPSWR